jgi:hypothetical protein
MSIEFTVRVKLPETIIDHPEFEGRLETIMGGSNYSDIVLGNTVLAEFGDYNKATIAEKALEALIIELDTKPELKMHNTIYFEIPKGYTIDSYRQYLSSLSKLELLSLATDCGDIYLEQNV